MKRLILLTCFCLMLMPAPAFADKNCEAKEQRLQQQLEFAHQHGNTHRAAGLERALANVKTWCTDTSLKSKAEMKVLEKQDEVFEREQELEEAKASGKADKIAKRERKLEEARQELQEAEAKRDAL